MPERKVTQQFRICSRKPGEQGFRFRRFPGCQTTGDEPLAWERLALARHQTPQWEFSMAVREIVTVTSYGDWASVTTTLAEEGDG